MKTLLTLDYELFLGAKTGSVENCLLSPMNYLLKVASHSNAPFTLFVDAAYLYMLETLRKDYLSLDRDYKAICSHLQVIQKQGHDLQLHIHPQWYFSEYNGREWHLDTEHYKLCDVEESQMMELFVNSKNLLDNIIGKKTIAFRAGGFSAQPTDLLVRLFNASGIRVDSSVCPGTSYDSDCQKYDYTVVPQKSAYHFSKDICQEECDGEFMEVPISMIKVSPVFHWKLALTKLAIKFGRGAEYKRMGDGLSVKTTGSSIFTRMTQPVQTMVTIDEFKASLLKRAYQMAQSKGNDYFCVLGHPKLATPYSVRKIGEFCDYVNKNGGSFITISDCYEG